MEKLKKLLSSFLQKFREIAFINKLFHENSKKSWEYVDSAIFILGIFSFLHTEEQWGIKMLFSRILNKNLCAVFVPKFSNIL